MSEKIVYIKRILSKNLTKNPALKMLNDNAFKYMGAAGYANTSLPVTGLTEKEKALIMPSLVQVSATHPEFDKYVVEYFHNLRELVPAGKGLKLNIATEKVEVVYAGEKETFDKPLNPHHYILWKRATSEDYKQCAKSYEETRETGDRVKFYVHDMEVETKLETQLGDERDKAYSAYLTLKEKPSLWDNILVIYGYDPDALNKYDKQARLRLLAEADGITDRQERLDAYTKFANIASDKDAELKAFLSKTVNKGVIVKEGNSYIYGSVTIGKNEEEALNWLKNKDHSKDYEIMKAKLDK